MEHPGQAGGLQGCHGGSCDTLAVNVLGTGSGWQQNKQNWAPLAVVGQCSRRRLGAVAGSSDYNRLLSQAAGRSGFDRLLLQAAGRSGCERLLSQAAGRSGCDSLLSQGPA